MINTELKNRICFPLPTTQRFSNQSFITATVQPIPLSGLPDVVKHIKEPCSCCSSVPITHSLCLNGNLELLRTFHIKCCVPGTPIPFPIHHSSEHHLEYPMFLLVYCLPAQFQQLPCYHSLGHIRAWLRAGEDTVMARENACLSPH